MSLFNLYRLSVKRNISLSSACCEIFQNDVQNKFVMQLPTDDAYVKYSVLNGTLDLTKIFVPRAYRGLGIGERLAQEVFEYCVNNGLKLVLTCPYLITFLANSANPKFRSIVIQKRSQPQN